MTLPILAQTAKEADPRRNYRLRDFLETLGLRAVFVPDPGPVAALEAAPAAEGEAPAAPEAPEGETGSEDEAVPVAGDEAPAAGQPALEPYDLKSIAVPAKDEPAEADAEVPHGL